MTRRTARPAAPSIVVGYVRVSTDEQALGPVAQRQALERWCAARGARLASVHEDLGVSGAAEMDRRPGLLAAVAALKASGAGVLLVSRRDRLARDVVAAALVERLADRVGARVESADGVGSGTGPEAALMRRIVDAVAEYERALIRARTKAALGVKRARGERVSGSIPYGYRLAADGRRLEQDPAEQAVVEAVRRLRAEGMTLRGIAARLESEGSLARDGKPWHPSTLARLARGAA